jgi:hypothetical protein
VTLVEMGTHLATERAGMVTLHLTVGASELYPNRSWRSGAGSKPLRAAAVKSGGGERRRKRRDKIPSGEIRRDERKRTADDVPKFTG